MAVRSIRSALSGMLIIGVTCHPAFARHGGFHGGAHLLQEGVGGKMWHLHAAPAAPSSVTVATAEKAILAQPSSPRTVAAR